MDTVEVDLKVIWEMSDPAELINAANKRRGTRESHK